MNHDLTSQTAVRLVAAIADGTVSSREVVAAHLDRIDAVNGAVNAIISRRDRAAVLADADAADDASDRGALHGIPVAVKDLDDVAGLPTRHGSRVTPDRAAKRDGLVAARLRAAGAIIIAKTTTPEFGAGSHTFNEINGLTRNPWNLGRSAGGSSGGSAAALAARMLPIANGSDLGGSLRNPAAFNNVVGLRGSIGRVPRPSERSQSPTLLGVSGPMARTVGDTALLMSVLAGFDERDPLALHDNPAVFAAPLPTETTARVGWVGNLHTFDIDPEPLALARTAAAAVTDVAGSFHELALELPGAERIFRVLRGIAFRDLGRTVPRDMHPLMKETVRQNIAFGDSLTGDDLLEVERLRVALHHHLRETFRHVDVLALPTTQVAPFPGEWEYPETVNGRAQDDYLGWMMSCCLITATECPAISIPAGFTTNRLPVGLQLVAPIGHDRYLLEVANAIEAAQPYHQVAPQL